MFIPLIRSPIRFIPAIIIRLSPFHWVLAGVGAVVDIVGAVAVGMAATTVAGMGEAVGTVAGAGTINKCHLEADKVKGSCDRIAD